MVESTLRSLKRYVKRGVSRASYYCFALRDNYDIYFGGKFPSFHFTVERDLITVEEISADGHLVLFLQYMPSLSKRRMFRSEIYQKYCDIFKRRYDGNNYGDCYVAVNPANCPFFGANMYNLYSTLVSHYVYPFLSRLLESKFRIVSCNSRVLMTPHITLESIGDFSYLNRFVFIYRDVVFTINCDEPEESIRKAIRFIMRVL